jgi:hypothetical protein
MRPEDHANAQRLADRALASSTRKQYRNAHRRYNAFAAQHGRNPGDPETLLVYLHTIRAKANTTLRGAVNGVRAMSPSDADPTGAPAIHRYLVAHGRVYGTRGRPNADLGVPHR